MKKAVFLILFVALVLPSVGQSYRKLKRAINSTDTVALQAYFDKGLGINKSLRKGNRLIHLACEANNLETLKFLLRKEANVNALNNDKHSAAMISTFKDGNSDSILKLLILHGADLNILGKRGVSVLRNLVFQSMYDPTAWRKVELVLKSGADPNLVQSCCCDRTPLHNAVSWQCVQVVQLLLNYGADKSRKDCDGRTPLDYARIVDNQELINLLK